MAKNLLISFSKRLFSRKQPQHSQILQNQKNKIEEIDQDLFHLITKNPELFKLQEDMEKERQISQSDAKSGKYNELEDFKKLRTLKILNNSLLREYEHELKEYKIHKKIANTLCDLGYLLDEKVVFKKPEHLQKQEGVIEHIVENGDQTPQFTSNRYHRLIKQTSKFMVVLTFGIKRRFIIKPEVLRNEEREGLKKLAPLSFGDFLKKNNMVPPDLLGPEYDEMNIIKDYYEGLKVPGEEKIDRKEDVHKFDIALVNKHNQAFVGECVIRMGELKLTNLYMIMHEGDIFVKNHWHENFLDPSGPHYKRFQPVNFNFLSESLQSGIIEFLYSVGVNPEVGLCIEYLSFNKEQRMYMAWLRDIYKYFNEELDKNSHISLRLLGKQEKLAFDK